MGRQVNFWVLERDAQEFAQLVLSKSDVVMIGRLSPRPYLCIITELPRPPERWWWAVYFWNRDFSFEPEWVQVREGPDRGLYAFAPSNQDPVIQFHRSVLRESGELSEGRIWTGCRDEGFLRWYQRTANWIRRRYKKVRKRGNAWIYAGPQAYEWYKAGGLLGR
jgi:hypothetical protein